MLSHHLKLDDHEWSLQLSQDHELSFSYLIPSQPLDLWEWKGSDIEESSSCYSSYVEDLEGISIFRARRALLSEISKLINLSHFDFFYFTPTTKRRGRVYYLIADRLCTMLHGNWSYQIYDKEWFYFQKSED